MSIFEAFETPKDLRNQYETSPCTAGVMGLKTLNVICGPNNSGKSRLLRGLVGSLIGYEPAFMRNALLATDAIKQEVGTLGNDIVRHFGTFANHDPLTVPIRRAPDWNSLYSRLLRLMLGGPIDNYADALKKIEGNRIDIAKTRDRVKAGSTALDGDRVVYVPAIRTCRQIGDTEGIFAHIRDRYFPRGIDDKAVYSGQELYGRVRESLLGRPVMRQRVRDFERLLSAQFFDGRDVSLSPREHKGNGELHIRIEPETERAISHLGDGLQSIIIQLAPAFLSQGKSLILCIEEPELYLHPGLQRRLFEVLLDLEKHTHWERHQVFVTSHSNHLLDLTLDHERIAILRVEKNVGDRSDDEVRRATAEEDAKFKVEMVTPGEIRLLHDLGVQSSSVFLSNCTIWVEGPTDRIILRRYMELVAEDEGVELREDLDYSFVFYAGSVAKHLSLFDDKGPDVNRICSHMLFVADYDGEKKAADAETLKDRLGDRFHRLECREIENTVSSKVLRRVVAAWTKNDPEKLELIDQDDIANQGIGKLINDHYAEFLKERDRWADEDGGLNQKRKTKFAELVREHTTTIADLSPAALAVAQKAVAFIKDHRAAANSPAA